MARALSHLHSLIRGSVGGLTYFSNQFHQICMRQRTAPVQPNTPFQTGIRTAFNAAEAAWESLSEQARTDWADYAATCVYPGPAGDYTVPGRQLMIGTLALAFYADGIQPEEFVVHASAPIIAGWFNPASIHVGIYVGETQGIAVVISNQTGREAVAVVDVSIAFNLTRNRYKGPWQSASKIVAITGLGSKIATIDRPAGTLGQAIFTRTRVFSAAPFGETPAPHSLAFPAFLRHICAEPPVNGIDSPAGSKKARAK